MDADEKIEDGQLVGPYDSQTIELDTEAGRTFYHRRNLVTVLVDIKGTLDT
jgi:hypothetical protein